MKAKIAQIKTLISELEKEASRANTLRRCSLESKLGISEPPVTSSETIDYDIGQIQFQLDEDRTGGVARFSTTDGNTFDMKMSRKVIENFLRSTNVQGARVTQ
jgi:hypothetical protein